MADKSSDQSILISATTIEEYVKLSNFRACIPEVCKAQIESIRSRHGMVDITYLPTVGKSVWLPKGATQLDYIDTGMIAHYPKGVIRVPLHGKLVDVVFVDVTIAVLEVDGVPSSSASTGMDGQ